MITMELLSEKAGQPFLTVSQPVGYDGLWVEIDLYTDDYLPTVSPSSGPRASSTSLLSDIYTSFNPFESDGRDPCTQAQNHHPRSA